MAVVSIPTPLRPHTGGLAQVEAQGPPWARSSPTSARATPNSTSGSSTGGRAPAGSSTSTSTTKTSASSTTWPPRSPSTGRDQHHPGHRRGLRAAARLASQRRIHALRRSNGRRPPRSLQPPGPLPRPRRGGPAPADGQPRHALRLRGARHRAGQPPRPRRASATSGSSTATSSRRTTSSGRSSSTSRTSPTTCPRPRPPRGSSGRSTAQVDDRAGRHRHRPHEHPRPGRRRRPDPRRHRQLRDPLPDQRRGGEAGQAVDLRRRDRQRRADDDDPARARPPACAACRDQPAAGDDPDLRDGRRARPGGRRDRLVRGRRGDQAPQRAARRR